MLLDIDAYSYSGGDLMNDPEVMERIANALESIAFFLELHVRGEE